MITDETHTTPPKCGVLLSKRSLVIASGSLPVSWSFCQSQHKPKAFAPAVLRVPWTTLCVDTPDLRLLVIFHHGATPGCADQKREGFAISNTHEPVSAPSITPPVRP